MGNVFRTNNGQDVYDQYRKNNSSVDSCALCEGEPLKEFVHWKIMNNKFPYDRLATEHHMLLPKRHSTEPDLTQEEIDEFQEIKHEALD